MSRKSGALTYRIPMGLFRPVAGQLCFLQLGGINTYNIKLFASNMYNIKNDKEL
jgi:hypothetical protein